MNKILKILNYVHINYFHLNYAHFTVNPRLARFRFTVFRFTGYILVSRNVHLYNIQIKTDKIPKNKKFYSYSENVVNKILKNLKGV